MADTEPVADPGADTTSADEEPNCGSGNSYNGSLGLRIGGVFIILVTSLIGTLFPIIAKKIPSVKIPKFVWDFCMYFGSGVIIATAFIHLLSPALDELGSECLTGTWTQYPWALAICLLSVFCIFLLELFAYRLGAAWLETRGLDVIDTHGPGVAHGPEQPQNHNGEIQIQPHNHSHHPEDGTVPSSGPEDYSEKNRVPEFSKASPTTSDSAIEAGPLLGTEQSLASSAAQIIGVAILEFGVVVHSVIIGLTLAVTNEFDTLFIVIIFHQMFEGLGLGTRLALMPLHKRLSWVPLVAGAFYAFITPIGMAIGLGVRSTYNPDGKTASIVSGVLDATSAGILLWTGLVELLAHQFLFNDNMRKAPIGVVAFGVICTLFGAGIMALLGRWA